MGANNNIDTATDPLQQAIENLGGGVTSDAAAIPTQRDLAAADEARNRLSQESFLADPASMRSAFPQVLKDINDRYPDWFSSNYLNMDKIQRGLDDPGVSQADKNLLTVLNAGYSVLSESPDADVDHDMHPKSDPNGISAESLAGIDKAVNRGIHEDPYFKDLILKEPLEDAASFAVMGGAFMAYETHSAYGAVTGAAVFGAAGAALGLVRPLILKFGLEDTMYDHVKADYLAFRSAFDQKSTSGDGGAGGP